MATMTRLAKTDHPEIRELGDKVVLSTRVFEQLLKLRKQETPPSSPLMWVMITTSSFHMIPLATTMEVERDRGRNVKVQWTKAAFIWAQKRVTLSQVQMTTLMRSLLASSPGPSSNSDSSAAVVLCLLVKVDSASSSDVVNSTKTHQENVGTIGSVGSMHKGGVKDSGKLSNIALILYQVDLDKIYLQETFS
ncbi:hypothetical protein ACH5RR_029778 [Cinchona calisaya]|uniref:Uncharacterized protein n=1 Tax=Cinchona calisaya TaxID=153742 RepID=A0ABD2YX04_9GENT